MLEECSTAFAMRVCIAVPVSARLLGAGSEMKLGVALGADFRRVSCCSDVLQAGSWMNESSSWGLFAQGGAMPASMFRSTSNSSASAIFHHFGEDLGGARRARASKRRLGAEEEWELGVGWWAIGSLLLCLSQENSESPRESRQHVGRDCMLHCDYRNIGTTAASLSLRLHIHTCKYCFA